MDFNPDRLYERYSLPLAIASVSLMPLKLVLVFFALIPLILLWLLKSRHDFGRIIRETGWFTVPLLFFIGSVAVSSLFGLDLLRSLRGLRSLVFFSLLILVLRDLSFRHGPLPFLYALIVGQSLAALHSILDGAFPGYISHFLLGEVTESGQLALTLMAATGLAVFLRHQTAGQPMIRGGEWLHQPVPGETIIYGFGLLNAVMLVALSFRPRLGFNALESTLLVLVCALSLAGCLALGLRPFRRHKVLSLSAARPIRLILLSVLMPLLVAALMVNLKRGPWAGVLVGGTILLFFFERKRILPLLILAISAIIFLESVQTRLAQSSRDFFIAGGRSVIWEIGTELSTRYPLGVGYKNSPFLRKFSQEIPPQLTHFHNNAINILVETGWISLLLYAWWLFVLIKSAFVLPARHETKPLALGLGCALIAWQVGGVVEYNFGDAEVLLIAFVLMGLLAQLAPSRLGQRTETAA